MKCMLIGMLLLSACRHPKPRLQNPAREPAAVSPAPPVAVQPQPPDRPAASPAPSAVPELPPVVPGEEGRGKARKSVEETNLRLRDAYFDYERSALRLDAQEALHHDYQILRGLLADFPTLNVTVEGHCDERGSAEYNLALGDRRAGIAIQYLTDLGLPSAKLRPVSFGKENPQCAEPAEDCWQKNRRVHLVVVESY